MIAHAKPLASSVTQPSLVTRQEPLLQRKCACDSGSRTSGEYGDNAESRGKTRLPDRPPEPAPQQDTERHFGHDFAHIPVYERGAPAVQPKLVIGAPGDRFEQEADAVADQVMRQTDERPADPAARDGVAPLRRKMGDSTGLERIQRQANSPFRLDEGLVTEEDGTADSGADRLQTKAAPGAQPAVAPGVAAGIQALRTRGAPLAAPLRSFMESRFGHDFGQVRVHTGGTATAVAQRINARAFTVGRDVVFGDGQFAADSHSGQRLIAHELTHVVQQGHAPPLSPARSAGPAARQPLLAGADPDPGVIRRVKWHPNTATGKKSAPWGPGRPVGKVLTGKTEAGTSIDIWRPDDGATYWCHGYTFGGKTAKGGPYSVWGESVPTILADDGWKSTSACMAQPSDIMVFRDAKGQVAHSGIIRSVVSSAAGQVDEANSTVESKWGYSTHNTSSWETNAKGYGRYVCYSKAPLTGVCGSSANEG